MSVLHNPQRDGDRQPFDDQFRHRAVAVVGFAEIEREVVLDHQPEALMGRLVEAIHLLDAFDQLRRQPFGTAIVSATDSIGAAAGKTAAGTAGGDPLQFRQGLFHRAARGGLDDDEIQQQNAEQGGQYQQQPFANVEFHHSAVLSHHVSRAAPGPTYLPNSGCLRRDW